MHHPKIFGLGLSRTGTTSLHAALVLLGKASCHYPAVAARHWLAGQYESDPLSEVEACVDLPTPVFFRELDRAYPGSRFILTVRDEGQWLESVGRFLGGTAPSGPRTILRDMIRVATYGMAGFHAERFREVFRQHRRAVEDYFADRPETLLVMDISAGDGWEALCRFLGIGEQPCRPFPRLDSPYLGQLSNVTFSDLDHKRQLLERHLDDPSGVAANAR